MNNKIYFSYKMSCCKSNLDNFVAAHLDELQEFIEKKSIKFSNDFSKKMNIYLANETHKS